MADTTVEKYSYESAVKGLSKQDIVNINILASVHTSNSLL